MNENNTVKTFSKDELSILQPATGYRFSIDAIILSSLCRLKPGDRVLDIGTGCGVIALILANRFPSVSCIFGVDIQARMAEIARHNVIQNGLDDRIEIILADVKEITPEITGGMVDMVVCNPPHHKTHSGRINPDSQKAIARHEIALDLNDLMETSRRMIRHGGRFSIIYPSGRLVDLTTRMRLTGIEPKSIRFIHPRPGSEAILVAVEGIAGKQPSVKVAPPLYIYDASGNYSREIADMFKGPVNSDSTDHDGKTLRTH